MPFPPNPGRSDEDDASYTDTAQMIAREESHLCEIPPKVDCQSNSVGGKKRRERGCDHGHCRENEQDNISFPEWPILRRVSLSSPCRHERFQDCTRGSLGSSVGWGTRMKAFDLSYFKGTASGLCGNAGRLASSSTLEVPTILSDSNGYREGANLANQGQARATSLLECPDPLWRTFSHTLAAQGKITVKPSGRVDDALRCLRSQHALRGALSPLVVSDGTGLWYWALVCVEESSEKARGFAGEGM